MDKVTLITGAGKGIGGPTAELFAREGEWVEIDRVNDEAGQSVVKAIKSEGGKAAFTHVDVTDEASVERWTDAVRDRHERSTSFLTKRVLAPWAP